MLAPSIGKKQDCNCSTHNDLKHLNEDDIVSSKLGSPQSLRLGLVAFLLVCVRVCVRERDREKALTSFLCICSKHAKNSFNWFWFSIKMTIVQKKLG